MLKRLGYFFLTGWLLASFSLFPPTLLYAASASIPGVRQLKAGSGITLSPANGTGTVTVTNSSSGGTTYLSTFTYTFKGVQDVIANGAGQYYDEFIVGKQTITVIDFMAYDETSSSVSACVFNLWYSTPSPTNTQSYYPIDTSSVTINVNTSSSTWEVPSSSTVFYPGTRLLATVTAAPTSGILAGGVSWGILMEYFKWP